MKDAPGSAATLHSALLDYFGAPGKYQLGLRQPALLFSSVREILQIAAGRGAAEGKNEGKLREAAAFFIRAALLFPGADHYAVLGLPAGEDPKDLKERYRLLMRLTHPDFAPSGPAAWPADAAVRVNRAYEVLSSPVARKEYDEQLASLRVQRPSAVRPAVFAPARHVEHHGPAYGRKVVWALAAAAALGSLLLFWPRQEPEHLVQRVRTPTPPPRPLVTYVQAEAVSAAPEARVGDPAPTAPATVSVAPAPDPVIPPAPAPAAAVAQSSPPVVPAPTASTPRPTVAVAQPAPLTVPRAPTPSPNSASIAPGTTAPPLRSTPVPPRAPEPMRATGISLAALEDPSPPPPPPPPPIVQASPMPVSPPPVANPAVAAAPSAPAANKLTATVSLPSIPTPTLSDAQPLLTQVLQMLETGSSEQLLRLLDADARKQPGAQALSRQYEQLVRGGRPVRLSQVDFKGESRDGVLLVTGRIRMHAGEPTIGSHGERLLLRAEFVQRAGKVQLTGLSGASD